MNKKNTSYAKHEMFFKYFNISIRAYNIYDLCNHRSALIPVSKYFYKSIVCINTIIRYRYKAPQYTVSFYHQEQQLWIHKLNMRCCLPCMAHRYNEQYSNDYTGWRYL